MIITDRMSHVPALSSSWSEPARTLTWFNNMTQINAGSSKKMDSWIMRIVGHNRHNGRSWIHFPRNCTNDKADKDLKCIPGINIICSEDTEVLWRVEIVMIICWAGMTRDYCGPGLPEPWCMMPIRLPISDRNIIIHIVNTIIRKWNTETFCMDNSEIQR